VALRSDGHRWAAGGRQLAARTGVLLAALALALGPLALTGSAAGPVSMDARILLQGHARLGGWAAVEVDLQNDGPPISGELQMDGGTQSNARYATAVDLPTGSHQTYVLHAQPPAFGRNVKIDLVADGTIIDSVTVAYLVHDANQLVVGVVAERPAGIISQLDLPANAFGSTPAVVSLGVGDLPERSAGWSTLDRIVWQDVDSNQLTGAQLEAMRQWIAAGGRLVIVGGTAGIGTLSAFPDDLLPYRPTATLDLDPTRLTSLLGPVPEGATELPAMSGALTNGRALATSGDRVVAADLVFGSGRITILGFDPTTKWLAESKAVDQLWRGLLPDRTGTGAAAGDDSQVVNAVYQLPALALPPTFGLLVIIGAYILIVGPINYLILKRLDRRELAWITMPILVLGFSAASFGYGSLLRGTDVVVNEVAIVRGAPDATEATAQIYFGIFSPNRTTYRVDVPQGALLAAPISGDPFGQSQTRLDILQGTGSERPSAVRDLVVGSGSIRVVRAELPVQGPRIKASLELVDGVLVGTVENASDKALEGVAVVLGTSVAILGDLEPHVSRPVRLSIQPNPFGSSLPDQVVGQPFDTSSEAGIRRAARYQMVSQLSFDPTGGGTVSLAADRAVILAFGQDVLLDLRVGAEEPRRSGNVLYYVPVVIGIKGAVTFQGDLLRPNVVESSAQFFSKDQTFLSMGAGTATIAYQPIPFDGTFELRELRLQLSGGGSIGPGRSGQSISPLAEIPTPCTDAQNGIPAGCQAPRADLLPEVELFDRTGAGTWVRLPRLSAETTYTVTDPDRYVDPTTGRILVRFVNDNREMGLGFAFQVALDGTVR
jgi:hypothetical protein